MPNETTVNDQLQAELSRDSDARYWETAESPTIQGSVSLPSPVRSLSTKKNSLHIPFAPQGGVGKSWIAMTMADYLTQNGNTVVCLDADPTNKTLSNYKCLYATPITIFRNGDELDIEAMDECIEWIMSEPADFVLDIGSSGFVAFASYLMRDNLIQMIADSGKDVFIHTVVVGDRQNHTYAAAKDVIKQMPEVAKKVMWLNSAFGPIDREKDIRAFCDKNAVPVVNLWYQHRNSDEAAVRKMIRDGVTFSEALHCDSSPLARRRIEPFWMRIRTSIQEAIGDESL